MLDDIRFSLAGGSFSNRIETFCSNHTILEHVSLWLLITPRVGVCVCVCVL